MPRLTRALISDESGNAAPEGAGGVIAVERATRLLGAFTGREATLSLAQICERAQLNKSTALRLARTLGWAKYLVQTDDGTWRLGPAAGWIGACYQSAFDLDGVLMPMLRKLARESGHSASFFVRESNSRSCLYRAEGLRDERPIVHSGTAFPLDKGAPGRVILAFSGTPGESYESIRRQGYCIGMSERSTNDASVAAPIFGRNWQLLGAISVSGSTMQLTEADLNRLASLVTSAAQRMSSALGGHYVRKSR